MVLSIINYRKPNILTYSYPFNSSISLPYRKKSIYIFSQKLIVMRHFYLQRAAESPLHSSIQNKFLFIFVSFFYWLFVHKSNLFFINNLKLQYKIFLRNSDKYYKNPSYSLHTQCTPSFYRLVSFYKREHIIQYNQTSIPIK